MGFDISSCTIAFLSFYSNGCTCIYTLCIPKYLLWKSKPNKVVLKVFPNFKLKFDCFKGSRKARTAQCKTSKVFRYEYLQYFLWNMSKHHNLPLRSSEYCVCYIYTSFEAVFKWAKGFIKILMQEYAFKNARKSDVVSPRHHEILCRNERNGGHMKNIE